MDTSGEFVIDGKKVGFKSFVISNLVTIVAISLVVFCGWNLLVPITFAQAVQKEILSGSISISNATAIGVWIQFFRFALHTFWSPSETKK